MAEHATLKHYELLQRIGEGGMGVVYRARDTRLGRTVALKTLHPELAKDVERTRRFEREARIVSSISHPGIATLYDFDRDGDVTFLTMEFVEGPTLRECLARGPMPIPQILDCAVQLADALTAAHREGVIHRDLKPENVIASPSGYFKVLDFGVARMDDTVAGTDSSGTQTPTVSWATKAGGIIGTITYMSPEQALAQPLDARSDIFSFGSLIYELVTGKPAFTGNNEIATAHAITQDQPLPMLDQRPEAPPGLEMVVGKCLAKKPADRYTGSDALARDLRILRQDSQSLSGDSRMLEAYGARRARRRLWWAALPVSALLIAGALWFGRPTESEPPGALTPGDRLIPSPAPPATLGATTATENSRPRVVVAFFENNSGDPEADWLSRGLPEMLTTDLSRCPDLEVIATQRLYELLASAGRDPAAPLNHAAAAELARWAGATVVISGSVFKDGEFYRIDAQAYDTATGTVRAAHKSEGERLLPMVTELAAGLLSQLQLGSGEPAPDLRTGASPEAWRWYGDGRSLHGNLMFPEAADAYRRALAEDPDFALARLRLAITEQAMGETDSAAELVGQLGDEAEELPDGERLLAEAMREFLIHRDYEAGKERVEELIRRFPRETEAYLIWAGALSERSEQVEATGKLREAIRQDPNYLPAIAALADLMSELGLPREAATMLRDAGARNPGALTELQRLIEAHDPP